MDHVGLYVLLSLLVLGAGALGYHMAAEKSAARSMGIGGCMFIGAAFITGVYKFSATALYPEQALMFAAMDEFIFRLCAALIVAWIIGIFLCDYVHAEKHKTASSD